jgi:hypothetical protein
VLHSKYSIATVLRRYGIVISLSLLTGACGNKTSRAPNPTAYNWPDTIAYRVDFVSETQRNREPMMRFAESRTIHLWNRGGQYIGVFDSVFKTTQRPQQPLVLAPYLPEDTLSFFVKLNPHGQITGVSLACDPAVAACAGALPSTVLLELRRIIPRLPEWEAPSGGEWVDTLPFDDASRPRGTRGSVITAYTGRRDTVINGRPYWLIGWHAARQSFQGGAGASPSLGALPAVREDGITLVDKQSLMPALSTWAGAVPATPDLRALGATGTGFRGRAYLKGSTFDSLFSREIGP